MSTRLLYAGRQYTGRQYDGLQWNGIAAPVDDRRTDRGGGGVRKKKPSFPAPDKWPEVKQLPEIDLDGIWTDGWKKHKEPPQPVAVKKKPTGWDFKAIDRDFGISDRSGYDDEEEEVVIILKALELLDL